MHVYLVVYQLLAHDPEPKVLNASLVPSLRALLGSSQSIHFDLAVDAFGCLVPLSGTQSVGLSMHFPGCSPSTPLAWLLTTCSTVIAPLHTTLALTDDEDSWATSPEVTALLTGLNLIESLWVLNPGDAIIDWLGDPCVMDGTPQWRFPNLISITLGNGVFSPDTVIRMLKLRYGARKVDGASLHAGTYRGRYLQG